MRWNIHFVWSIYLFSMVCFCKEGGKRDKRRPSKSMTSVVHEVCMPPDSDRLVYRYMNDSHIFIGFDDIQRDTVYYMLWKISKVNSEALINESPNEFLTMPGIEAREHLKKEHLLAASTQKIQDRFRENLYMCSQTRITLRTCVIQSFAVLARKMKDVKFNKSCRN